ncbi:hypothetical protein JCM19233_5810 [Vibrio astriarenae]|nr:hypothetical protein JCM19233_5810 [Vibrio sp. C7]
MVCGDLISLEECLIYQFPDNMPSYQDYRAASDASAKVAKSNGLSTLTLASAVQKFATQELEALPKVVATHLWLTAAASQHLRLCSRWQKGYGVISTRTLCHPQREQLVASSLV